MAIKMDWESYWYSVVSRLSCSMTKHKMQTVYAVLCILCNKGVGDENTSTYLLLSAGRNAGKNK